MSGYNITGPLQTEFAVVDDNTATEVFTAEGATLIASIVVTENAGSTPNLTVDIYDSTNAYRIRRAVAATAGTAFIFDTPFVLPDGWSIRVTSSDAAGKFDVLVTYVPRVAAAAQRLAAA